MTIPWNPNASCGKPLILICTLDHVKANSHDSLMGLFSYQFDVNREEVKHSHKQEKALT